MKRLFFALLVLTLLVIGVTFSYRNSQTVEMNYYFGIHWVTPLSFMLLTTLTLGIALGFLASLAMLGRMQRQLLRARRNTRNLEQEIHNLRALPIRDAP